VYKSGPSRLPRYIFVFQHLCAQLQQVSGNLYYINDTRARSDASTNDTSSLNRARETKARAHSSAEEKRKETAR
jgi:hypothetical protein